MLRTTYQDPVVCDLVKRRFVPIWVDADRRPDISDRYTLGGWPTTTFLTPTGRVLGGETYADPDRMTFLLTQVADIFESKQNDLLGSPPPKPRVTTAPNIDSSPLPNAEVWLTQHLREQFDTIHAGFGVTSKRVQAPALRFALLKHHEGDTALGDVAVRTLEAIAWRGLYDDVDHGVFRFCNGRDWTKPSCEKLLNVNADTLQLLLDGWLVLGDIRYRERAADIIRYIRNNLVNREPAGFFASQAADQHYYASNAATRRHLEPPRTDRSEYSDYTARMAISFVHAAEVFEDSSLLEFAVASLERVVLDTYQRGQGVGHSLNEDQSVRGLLVDHVAVSDALLELYQATDRDAYLDMAQEIMLFAGRALWDPDRGGFLDRVVAPDDVGLLRQAVKPFVANCTAARVLARLSRFSGRHDFGERAEATLASQASEVQSQGIDAALWVLAARELE